MFGSFKQRNALWLGLIALAGSAIGTAAVLGVVVGMNLHQPDPADQMQIQWPTQQQMMASATHGTKDLAMATGQVDDDVEALFTLDYYTGDLKAVMLNVRTGKFTQSYYRSVREDLNPDAITVKNPQYLIVTGKANMRQGSRARISRTIVYVAEINTGVVAAYGVRWVPGGQNNPIKAIKPAPFIRLDRFQFRNLKIREQ